MEVKILTIIISFVLYQSVVLQVIQSPIIEHLNTPFNHPNHHHHNRPLGQVHHDQNINRQHWISFPDRFPFNNHRLDHRLIPVHLAIRRPMHHHPHTPSHLGTSITNEYLNGLNTPSETMTMTEPNINGNMNKPTNLWYRPHGTESSMGFLNRPSNKPCQSQATESSVLYSNPPGPTNTNQAVDTIYHEHDKPNILNLNPPKDNPNIFNSNPPKDNPNIFDSNPPKDNPNIFNSNPPKDNPYIFNSNPPKDNPNILNSNPPKDNPNILNSNPPKDNPYIFNSNPPKDNPNIFNSNPPKDNSNILNSNPPKDIQDDSIGDDSSPDIDIRFG